LKYTWKNDFEDIKRFVLKEVSLLDTSKGFLIVSDDRKWFL